MKRIICLALFSLLLAPTSALADGPSLDLNLRANPDKVNVGGSIAIDKLNLADIAIIKDTRLTVADSGKRITLTATLQLSQTSSFRLVIEVKDGRWTTLVGPVN